MAYDEAEGDGVTGIFNELRLILTYRLLGLVLTVAPKGTQEGRDIVNALAAMPMRKPGE